MRHPDLTAIDDFLYNIVFRTMESIVYITLPDFEMQGLTQRHWARGTSMLSLLCSEEGQGECTSGQCTCTSNSYLSLLPNVITRS